MLVLSRRRSEQIVVDGPCVITVIEIGAGRTGNKVRLGFTADPSVRIDRREVWEAKEAKAREQQANEGSA